MDLVSKLLYSAVVVDAHHSASVLDTYLSREWVGDVASFGTRTWSVALESRFLSTSV